jgi:anaerobic selenocysteine-containing dehydrogenase
MSTHVTTCPFCEAMCGLRIDVTGGTIQDIRGDPDDALSRGFLCPKAMAVADVQADPERLREPLVRRDGRWQTVSWDEALTEAASGLHKVQALHGRDSVAFYTGNPNLHSYTAQLAELVFRTSLGTRAVFSTASIDQLPHLFVSYLMFGHQLLLPVPDLDRTAFLLVIGANPAESNGSLMGAPGVPRRLRELRARGGRVVVVDPRRTRTADLADTHHHIVPGTDALLLAAMVQTLTTDRQPSPGRLAAFTRGIEDVARAVSAFAPERVADTVGIRADDIRSLARAFADAPSAVCYPRIGACTQEFGALSCWLAHVLNVITGNLDRPGGAMFTKPAVDIVRVSGLLRKNGSYRSWTSRVRGLPEFAGELPVAVLAEEIETPGDGSIRALVTSAGNPVLSTPEGGRLHRALPSLDFMVAIDFYLNETTRHAHVILPPVFALERDHYDIAFRAFGVRNTAKYSEPVLPAPPGSRTDWDIYLDLARRLEARRDGLASWFSGASLGVLHRIGPRRLLDLLLRLGPHRLSIDRLRREVHTIDLGPLSPCLPERLFTRDAQIDLAPGLLMQDLTRLSERMARRPAAGSLLLIGRRQMRNHNSWLHNSARLMKGPDRCTLMMHPDDASVRSLRAGQRVAIRSAVGAVTAPLELSDGIMPGVVSLPHGFGHGQPDTRLAVANAHPGASLNDLTDGTALDVLTGTAAFSGTPVVVAAASESDAARPAPRLPS